MIQMRKGKSKEIASYRSNEKEATKTDILNQQFKPADLTWVEIHDSSWWPAQVVDEGSVSDKPRKKFKNELLVRLYGTYKYIYVDASKSNSEFEDVLKRENKTMKEKFQEAVEKDMSLMLSKGKCKLEASKSEGTNSAEASKDKKQQSEFCREPAGKEADKVSTAMKVGTKKEKAESSSKRERKLDLSKEKRGEKESKPSNSEERKVGKHTGTQNHENSILRRSPRVATPMKVGTEKEKTESLSKRKRELGFSKEEREEKESKPSKSETPNSEEHKIAKHAGSKNLESSILRRSPRVAPSGTKEKTESPSKRKRKLDFSKEEREEKESLPFNSQGKKVAKHAGIKYHESSISRKSPRFATAMKVGTEKEKTESSSKRGRDLDFSKEEREGKESELSEAETPNSKEQKVAKHARTKNHESLTLRQSPCVASVVKTPSTESAVETPISENEEKIKAKDLEIRKIVIDIIFGGTTNLPKNRSAEIGKDATQGDTSNAEASQTNCRSAAEKSDLKATYSRKKKSPKQGDGEMNCENRRNEGVKEGKGKFTKAKTSQNEAEKRSNLNSKHAEKKAEGNSKAKSPELEAETPATVKDAVLPSVEKGLISERQVRVMQSLALIAPVGSPFGKNGCIL